MTRTPALIAVVDDDDSVCHALQRLVCSIGYAGEAFNCGEDFLERLACLPSFSPDCVLLDMHLPGLTGIEVQQRLVHTMLPVICMTADEEPGLREKALATGAVALLNKPFTVEVLRQTLRSALASDASGRRL